MKLIEETLYLVMALFISLPKKYKLLDLKVMKYYPLGNYDYMCWCGKLIHHRDFEQWYKDKQTWIHENIHLYQAKTHFHTWPGFYLSYLWTWISGAIYCLSWNAGYYTGKYEVEAYAKQVDEYYLTTYNKDSIKKYTFSLSERKKLWKEINGNPVEWIKLIREL